MIGDHSIHFFLHEASDIVENCLACLSHWFKVNYLIILKPLIPNIYQNYLSNHFLISLFLSSLFIPPVFSFPRAKI